jgi:hypothetical protein
MTAGKDAIAAMARCVEARVMQACETHWAQWRAGDDRAGVADPKNHNLLTPQPDKPELSPKERRVIQFYDMDIEELLDQHENLQKPLVASRNYRIFSGGLLMFTRRGWKNVMVRQ